MTDEERNAVIERTTLGIQDHGIFTFMLMMDCGSFHQGAGGYALDHNPAHISGSKRVATEYGMAMIMAILRIVGVDTWEELPGKAIRLKIESGTIVAIGNLLNDEWLHFKDFSDVWNRKSA